MTEIFNNIKIYGYPKSKFTGEEKELRTYSCIWCGYNFKQYVRRSDGAGKHSAVSTQVQCKQCKMYLRTWIEKDKK